MHDEHIAAGLELQYYRIRALGGVLRHFGKGSLLHARRDVGYTCDILHSLQIEDDLCIDMRQHITLIHSASFSCSCPFPSIFVISFQLVFPAVNSFKEVLADSHPAPQPGTPPPSWMLLHWAALALMQRENSHGSAVATLKNIALHVERLQAPSPSLGSSLMYFERGSIGYCLFR